MSAQTNTADLAAMRQQQVAPREASMPAVAPGFGSLQSFELMQRAAKLLSSSTLVPAAYRAYDDKKGENPNALANCVVSLNMAQRMGADPLMVMQNLYIVEGRPSWSSQWIIAAINGCGRFSPLRFELKNLGEKEVEYEVTKWVNRERQTTKHKATVQNLECIAWAIERETGERITSPAVNIEMAVKEGWYGKNGSKWQTMPEVMLRYRTASFFGKLYAPELLMGLQTVEEMQDIVIDATPDGRGGYSVDVESLKAGPAAEAAKAPDNVDTNTGEIIDAPATVVTDQDDALRQVEQQTGNGEFQPTADEIAEIHAREMAEAGQQTTSRPRRERGGMSME
ncbi:MAG TPA: hypothetical protein PLE35_04590 [Lentisphaeria bacterium]|nr:hypothetical protein [Lentisphaeria bacterium]